MFAFVIESHRADPKPVRKTIPRVRAHAHSIYHIDGGSHVLRGEVRGLLVVLRWERERSESGGRD